MVTSPGYGPISSVTPIKPYRVNAEKGTVSAPSSGDYDSVMLSAMSSDEKRLQLDAVSRVSQQVRTSVSTGDIQRLRQEVASGQYTPDPTAIAARILYLGEEF